MAMSADLAEEYGSEVENLEIKTIDGLGFFYRILINIKYFLPTFLKKGIDKLILLDFKYFK